MSNDASKDPPKFSFGGASSGSLFGSANNNASGGGLFGNSTGNKPAASTGGLFGASAGQAVTLRWSYRWQW
ncbi:Nucleoporin Nsp1-like protein [Neofusicoccum parvum]|uniref:Nucleoporin Nsp1-like protein n=1 Tax=Neofusicoccum parvum TaxID=310453 RepID=A0ACB5RRY5_9PEZI|nr:Nucleoporin Nsp1-like protein [Neofusicoccum parvum]GME36901.1 Nucleoporin Nsp1-like protein [Neofusicoccum parvum]